MRSPGKRRRSEPDAKDQLQGDFRSLSAHQLSPRSYFRNRAVTPSFTKAHPCRHLKLIISGLYSIDLYLYHHANTVLLITVLS